MLKLETLLNHERSQVAFDLGAQSLGMADVYPLSDSELLTDRKEVQQSSAYPLSDSELYHS